jgi:D-sedoheptulose 7-phosphate isomerase
VSSLAASDRLSLHVERERERRQDAGVRFFELEADRIATLCHLMAERFAREGRLLALGATPAARSDARHVAVEFVHPVIVGKRALPALALTAEGGQLDVQLALQLGSEDVVIAFGGERDEQTRSAIAVARERGALTISFPEKDAGAAEWGFPPPGEDPRIDQELVETLYHVLWELVHVFFEHRGLLRGRSERRVHDSGASSFLYPFLAEQEDDLDAVLRDVRDSVLAKASDARSLRAQTLADNASVLVAAARALRGSFDAGGRLLALGNGGSATDAMDLVADLRFPQASSLSRGAGDEPAVEVLPRPALDLTEDTGIITAVANDIGNGAIFSRQVIAHGRRGDVLVALSTSGRSTSVIEALAEARRRGLVTVAFVGYDGGSVLAEGLADHVLVTRAEHIPRIQEAQASAYHVLCDLVELAGQG